MFDLKRVGKRERAVPTQAKDLMLLKGDLSQDAPSKAKGVAIRPTSFDRLLAGETHEGEVHVKCPSGVNPLRLQSKDECSETCELD